MRSSLGKHAAAMRDPNPENARIAAKAAWHEHGIILINPDWLLTNSEKWQAEAIATSLFGPRKTLGMTR